jgi:hypothetical protein
MLLSVTVCLFHCVTPLYDMSYSRNIETYLYVFPFRVSFRIIIRGHKNVLKFTTVVFLLCRITVQVASRHPVTTKTWIQSQYNPYGI